MTNTNEAANLGNKLIADAMSANQASDNRQSKLIMFMWDNETTYSKDNVATFFTVSGADRTEKIATAIKNISDDYGNVLEVLAQLQAEKKADKDRFSEAKALQVEQLTNKVRAANILFVRALTGIYHLRTIDAYEVKMKGNGAIAFMFDKKNDKGEAVVNSKGNPVAETATLSGNALVKAGEKALEAVKPAKKNAARNPAAGAESKLGMTLLATTIADRVRKQRLASPDNTVDFQDEEGKEIDRLLHELMAIKFLDEKGHVDSATVLEYVKLEFPDTDKATKADKKAA